MTKTVYPPKPAKAKKSEYAIKAKHLVMPRHAVAKKGEKV
jgi:hypothetical protein